MQYRLKAEMGKKMDEMEEQKKEWKVIGLKVPGTCIISVEKKLR